MERTSTTAYGPRTRGDTVRQLEKRVKRLAPFFAISIPANKNLIKSGEFDGGIFAKSFKKLLNQSLSFRDLFS